MEDTTEKTQVLDTEADGQTSPDKLSASENPPPPGTVPENQTLAAVLRSLSVEFDTRRRGTITASSASSVHSESTWSTIVNVEGRSQHSPSPAFVHGGDGSRYDGGMRSCIHGGEPSDYQGGTRGGYLGPTRGVNVYRHAANVSGGKYPVPDIPQPQSDPSDADPTHPENDSD